MKAGLVIGLSVLFSVCLCANNGEALTPPMGWNSWYALGCENLNEVKRPTLQLSPSF